MGQKLIPIPQEAALERLLAALAMDLAEASDDEITQAAKDLGMNVGMKGSAAFLGVHGLPRHIGDFFEVEGVDEFYRELLRRRRSLAADREPDDE